MYQLCDYTTSNGVITNPTTGGGDEHIWKYLYSVRAENKFVNSTYLMASTRNNESTDTDTVFNLDNSGVVEGELTTIVVLMVAHNTEILVTFV